MRKEGELAMNRFSRRYVGWPIAWFVVVMWTISAYAGLYFSDGFESGDFSAGGWATSGSASISGENPYSGNYCVKGPGTWSVAKTFSPIQESLIVVEYAMKASQTSSNSCILYIKDANGNSGPNVFFRHTGYIVAYNGSGYSDQINLMPYEANTWYHVKIVIDMQARTYDVYIDGALKADDFRFQSSDFGAPQDFWWGSGETWGVGWLDEVRIYAGTSAVENPGHSRQSDPRSFRVYQNYPNPFNGSTTICFTTGYRSSVRLAIYDTAGRLVRTLVDETLPGGEHRVVWDGRDAQGRNAPSGTYICRLVVGARRVDTLKLTYLR